MRKLLAWIVGIFRRKREGELYYIGGSDVLPPPLKGQEPMCLSQLLDLVQVT